MTALHTTGLVNPLDPSALVLGSIRVGMRILYWAPNVEGSARRVKIVSEDYTDEDGNRVIDVIGEDGEEHTELTSTLGLTPRRHPDANGHTVWCAVAAVDEDW